MLIYGILEADRDIQSGSAHQSSDWSYGKPRDGNDELFGALHEKRCHYIRSHFYGTLDTPGDDGLAYISD